MSEATLNVPGIHCEHCQGSIEDALGELQGVRSARVSVPERTVDVDYDESLVDVDTIKDTIIEQGYDLPA
ncbi:MAG TPA: heavy-metal-associated domain-containing protein [Acidimicrobiales bacterium]|nr:heavy-metal-associated domain-containing protein [Acidimicrobiales bacterium]